MAAYTLRKSGLMFNFHYGNDLPTFVIKGILGSTDQSMVEYRGRLSLVSGARRCTIGPYDSQDSVAEFARRTLYQKGMGDSAMTSENSTCCNWCMLLCLMAVTGVWASSSILTNV